MGCSNYFINLYTHEIVNGRGRIMRPYIDARGRESVKLTCSPGAQTTFVVKDIVRKILKDAPTIPEEAVIDAHIAFMLFLDMKSRSWIGVDALELLDIVIDDLPNVDEEQVLRMIYTIKGANSNH